MKKLHRSIFAAALGAGVLLSLAAHGQSYPARPVKLITTFPAGSVIDTTARTIAQRMTEAWKQPVTVESRPGGGGTGSVGADFAAKSAPDGYTWLLAPNSVMVIGPHLVKTPFDVFRDFTPVGQVANIPFLLVVGASVPAKTVTELVQYAKSSPGRLNYGSSGNGSPQHLGAELLKRAGGFDMTHVPYKGANQAIADLLGGRIEVFVGAAGSLFPLIRDGKIRMIASAGNQRLASHPQVPTIAETLPGVEVDAWLGLFMPAGVPRDIVTRVNADVTTALRAPELRSILSAQGIDVATSTPEGLLATMNADWARWGKLINEAKIKAD